MYSVEGHEVHTCAKDKAIFQLNHFRQMREITTQEWSGEAVNEIRSARESGCREIREEHANGEPAFSHTQQDELSLEGNSRQVDGAGR